MSFLSSKFSRIGSEPVKWEFTIVLVKLSSPSVKQASITIERGDHKSQSRTIDQKKDGYFIFNETMSMIITLYRKKDHQYLPKNGTLIVQDKNKNVGQSTFDFARYVDDDRSSVVGLEEDWRLEKAVDKFNSFVTVKVSAKKIGSSDVIPSINQSKADSEQKEDSEISEDEIPIPKARKPQPIVQSTAQSAKRKPVVPESDDEVLQDDSDDQVIDDDDDYAPPPARNSARSQPVTNNQSTKPTINQSVNQSSGTSFRNKPKAPLPKDSDDDDDDIPPPVATRRPQPKPAAAIAPKPKPVKDTSGMSAKEKLFADLDDDSDDDAPRRGKKAAAKPVAAPTSKQQPGNSNARDQLFAPSSNDRDKLFAKDNNNKGKSSPSPQASPAGRSDRSNQSTKSPSTPSLASLAKPARQITANQLFSCSLAESATVMPSKEGKDAPKDVPFILHYLLFHIERLNGLSAARLFKDYVEPAKSDEVKTVMEDPRATTWKLKKSQENPHVLGAVLKVWLQSLTDGLIPEQLHEQMLSMGALVNGGDEDETINQVAIKCLSKLPAVHRASLFALCDFLFTMSIPPYCKKNGMTAASLASTFAPVVAHIKVDPSKGTYEQFEVKNQINKAVEYLVRNPTIIEEAGDVAVDYDEEPAPAGVKFHEAESHDDDHHDEDDRVINDESDEVMNESEEEEQRPPPRKQQQPEPQSRKPVVETPTRKQPVEQPKPKKPTSQFSFDDDEDDDVVVDDEQQDVDSDQSDHQPPPPVKQSQPPQPTQPPAPAPVAKPAPAFDPRKQAEIERLRALRGKTGKSPEPSPAYQPTNNNQSTSKPPPKPTASVAQPAATKGKGGQWELNFFDDSDQEEPVDDDQEDDDEPEPTPPPKSQSRLPPPAKPEPPRRSPSPQPPPPPPPKEVAMKSSASSSPKRSESPMPPVDNAMMMQSTSRILELETANARLTADLETARRQIAAAVNSSSHMSSSHVATQAEVADLKKKLEASQKEREQLVKDKKDLQSKLKDSQLAAAAVPVAKSSNPDVRALQDRLAMFELQLESQADEFASKVEAEREVRARLKLEIAQLKDENEVLRQRHLRFEDIDADAQTIKEQFRGKDAMSAIIDQQRQRIEYLERLMKENEMMMKQAKETWHATSAMLETDIQALQHENDAMRASLSELQSSKSKSGKQFDMSLFESLKRSYAHLKHAHATAEQARAEATHSAESARAELGGALKTIISLEDDNKMLKEELTKTGLALKTIADDNFELKEYMRLHTKGKK